MGAPEPPFNAGDPDTAPPDVVASVRASTDPRTQRRTATARLVAARLGINVPEGA